MRSPASSRLRSHPASTYSRSNLARSLSLIAGTLYSGPVRENRSAGPAPTAGGAAAPAFRSKRLERSRSIDRRPLRLRCAASGRWKEGAGWRRLRPQGGQVAGALPGLRRLEHAGRGDLRARGQAGGGSGRPVKLVEVSSDREDRMITVAFASTGSLAGRGTRLRRSRLRAAERLRRGYTPAWALAHRGSRPSSATSTATRSASSRASSRRSGTLTAGASAVARSSPRSSPAT